MSTLMFDKNYDEYKNQVCSYKLAVRLKELGVKQESIFYWDCIDFFGNKLAQLHRPDTNEIPEDYVSAFTEIALRGELPTSVQPYPGKDEEGNNVWFCEYRRGEHKTQDRKLANAFAKMLIHLLENELINQVP